MVKAYLEITGEEYTDSFLLLLIERVIEDYQRQRHYPDGMDASDITADTEAYFNVRKGYVATEVIPAMIGKVGGEGLYSLVDNRCRKTGNIHFQSICRMSFRTVRW